MTRATAPEASGPEWDRCCHVCWNRVYAGWIDEPTSACMFGHAKAHECPDAMAAAANTASILKALKAARASDRRERDA